MKYGYFNFNLEILEYCNKELLLEREQYYLDLYKPEYNICKIAGSSKGRIVKDPTRLKLRHARLINLFLKTNKNINFSLFVLNVFENKIKKSELRILKFYETFNKIIPNNEIEIPYKMV